MKKQYALLLGLLVFSIGIFAQNASPIYDVLVKGGHVIDAKNGIDGVMDIAIKQGKIFKVDKNLNAKASSKKPKTTFTLFNQPPLFGKLFNQEGNRASIPKGNAKAKENPNIPIITPIIGK